MTFNLRVITSDYGRKRVGIDVETASKPRSILNFLKRLLVHCRHDISILVMSLYR